MGDRGLQSPRPFLSHLNVVVGHERGIRCLAVAVGEAVKRVGVALAQPPTFAADKIEDGGKLFRRFAQGVRLLWARMQLQAIVRSTLKVTIYSGDCVTNERRKARGQSGRAAPDGPFP